MAANKPQKPRPISAVKPDYVVMTVSELDRAVYEVLVQSGAASLGDAPGTYIVSDRDAARSSVVMPKVLNKMGATGLRLVAVNKMECFIFAQDTGVKYKYLVMTPPEMDRVAIEILQREGQLALAGFEGSAAKIEVIDAAAGRIQTVLPKVLKQICGQTWQLAAISGPQLYIFISADP